MFFRLRKKIIKQNLIICNENKYLVFCQSLFIKQMSFGFKAAQTVISVKGTVSSRRVSR
jgi:hypothetical protein